MEDAWANGRKPTARLKSNLLVTSARGINRRKAVFRKAFTVGDVSPSMVSKSKLIVWTTKAAKKQSSVVSHEKYQCGHCVCV